MPLLSKLYWRSLETRHAQRLHSDDENNEDDVFAFAFAFAFVGPPVGRKEKGAVRVYEKQPDTVAAAEKRGCGAERHAATAAGARSTVLCRPNSARR